MKIKNLLEYFLSEDRPIFLSSWQRNFVWSCDKILKLYETILLKMFHDYCTIDPIKIGVYNDSTTQKSLIFGLNYLKPIIGKAHKKIGEKFLKVIKHLQDGQQRICSILFMLFGHYITDKNGMKQYLFIDLMEAKKWSASNCSKIFYFSPKDNTIIRDGGETTGIRAKELFALFLDKDTGNIQRQQKCEDYGIDIDDIEDLISHILNFEIGLQLINYNDTSEALDDFLRSNSGQHLNDYEIFINHLVEWVGDYEFDNFFENAKNEMNNSISIPKIIYFHNRKRMAKHDFALNLMSFRTRPSENETKLDDFPQYIIQGTQSCLDNLPINEETINDFNNKLQKFIRKLINTKIKIKGKDTSTTNNRNFTWDVYLPFDSIINSHRQQLVYLLRFLGNGIEARSNNPLEKQAIRYILHALCKNRRTRRSIPSASSALLSCNSLEEFADKELMVYLDDISMELKSRLVVSNFMNNSKPKKDHIFTAKDERGYTFRTEEKLTTNVSESIMEFLPAANQRNNTDRFLERRKQEINDRVINLLSNEYDIKVIS